MNKLLTIIKREYISRVRTKGFIIATLLLPISMVIFTIVPALLMNIKTGDATRLTIVDGSGKLAAPLERALSGEAENDGQVSDLAARQAAENRRDQSMDRSRFAVTTRDFAGESPDEIKRKLNDRVAAKELDAFLIIPPDILGNGEAQYYGRNMSDFVSLRFVRDALTRTVRDTRLVESGIELGKVRAASAPVKMSEQKATNDLAEAESSGGFIIAYVVGFLIYFTIIIYGQTILSAVVEEKTTRIAEVLFSSARAFPLMLGKLVGVSLVALTQFTIWAVMFLLLTLYGVGALAASGVNIADVLPRIPVSVLVYIILFFILGYFIYATLYALVGAMVTTTQEGAQLATPVFSLLIAAFFVSFTVIRSPSSEFSFWVSLVPFFSPITMLVRIVTETPPFWQIALSLAIGYATVIGLVWLAARIYRTGMLMYGKRASLAEALRWVRQS